MEMTETQITWDKVKRINRRIEIPTDCRFFYYFNNTQSRHEKNKTQYYYFKGFPTHSTCHWSLCESMNITGYIFWYNQRPANQRMLQVCRILWHNGIESIAGSDWSGIYFINTNGRTEKNDSISWDISFSASCFIQL